MPSRTSLFASRELPRPRAGTRGQRIAPQDDLRNRGERNRFCRLADEGLIGAVAALRVVRFGYASRHVDVVPYDTGCRLDISDIETLKSGQPKIARVGCPEPGHPTEAYSGRKLAAQESLIPVRSQVPDPCVRDINPC